MQSQLLQDKKSRQAQALFGKKTEIPESWFTIQVKKRKLSAVQHRILINLVLRRGLEGSRQNERTW